MTAFGFRALRPDGASVRGTVEAATAQDAAALVSRRGLLPVVVRPVVRPPSQWLRTPDRDVATVFQGLAALVSAGVPLANALSVTRRLAGPSTRDPLARVESRVREGATLAASLGAEPETFSPLIVGMVRAGEQGAGLAHALADCADRLTERAALSARIRAALAYPLLLALFGSVSIIVIVVIIVPRFAVMLADVRTGLPVATRVLLSLAAFARAGGWVVLPVVTVVALLLWVQARHDPERWHERLLRLPVVGPLRHTLSTSRCAATLASLLEQGTPALAALRIAEETVADHAIAQRLRRARERVAQGASFAAALEAEAALTDLTLRMAAIGDHAGRLPDLLRRAAKIEQERAESRLKTLSGVIEPVMVVTFALLVAVVAAALLQAVYSLRPS